MITVTEVADVSWLKAGRGRLVMASGDSGTMVLEPVSWEFESPL